MNWGRIGRLILIVIGNFVAVALAGLLLIFLIVPTWTQARLVAFIGAMFAVTEAILVVNIWVAALNNRK